MTAPQNTSDTPQSPTKSLHLHCGNNVDVLQSYPDCHFDAIVTDPPYGIEFLGKDWDSHTGAIETWQQCLRVLKPGGHLLAFSAARTYHHLATNIESTGFEIRDQLMWIYSSGFPKAQDMGKAIQRRQGVKKTQAYKENIPRVGGKGTTDAYDMCKAETVCTSPEAKQWLGWKTALKPGHEPIVMARKPMKGSTIDCVLKHGVGALNIDATRIPFDQQLADWYRKYPEQKSKEGVYENYSAENRDHKDRPQAGRTGFKVQRGVVKRPTGGADGLSRLEFGEREPIKYKDQKRMIRAGRDPRNRLKDLESQTTPADHNHEETPVYEANPQGRYPSNVMGDIPDYQKYFYCPKVSRKERHVGFEQDHLPKRLIPMPGENGLKDIYDCYDKDWANKKDSANNKIKNNWEMVRAMGGHYITATGDPIREDGDFGNQIVLPDQGYITTHGLKSIYEDWCKKNGKQDHHGNNHPTVKPVALMRYLIQLVTPVNSIVLDPFMGSGSTGMAACELGHTFVGIDLDPSYVAIAEKRIKGWVKPQHHTSKTVEPTDLFDDLFE